VRRPVAQFSVALVCLLLGLGLVSQFRTYHTVAKSELSPADEALVIGDLVDGNAALRREVSQLQSQLDQYGQPDSAAGVDAMRADLDQLRLATGVVPVRGPGVDVEVDGYVRTEELGDLVNELRNAGAEAIAVNGKRLSARSVFVSAPEEYQLDGEPISPPFRFSAIGLPSTLQTALLRKGGAVALLQAYHPSLPISVTQDMMILMPVTDSVVPAQSGGPPVS